MNEWVLGGIVALGTLILVGGGGWVLQILRGKNTKTPQA